jgi:hypothetical protein
VLARRACPSWVEKWRTRNVEGDSSVGRVTRSLNVVVVVVVVVVAVIGFPVLVLILLIEGVWWPAAIVAASLVMSWWRGRHNGRYLPVALTRWHQDRRP